LPPRSLSIAAIVFLAACSTSAQPPRTQLPTDVVATIGSTSVTLAELDSLALSQPAGRFGSMTLSQAVYEARRSALETLVGDRLIAAEATARGVDQEALVEQEIGSKVAVPTATEITAWYQANPSRVGGATLDQVQGAIAELLTEERAEAARSAFVDGLKAKTRVALSLEPPRLVVADGGRPARGPANAPITIVEFSDFQCPYCQTASPTVAKVLQTYGERIRFVYRHYPLPNHPAARPAAEASLCAADQDQFWPYHDRLFANPSQLTNDDLKRHAAELKLDTAKFNACFDGGRHAKEVDVDLAAGNALGVSGTPAFFVNGRALTGAQPFEAFKQLIDEELAR
jgi:protein-disulfide isomerase